MGDIFSGMTSTSDVFVHNVGFLSHKDNTTDEGTQ